jgi:hypothetical protein
MRRVACLTTILLACASPAWAGTIVEDLSFSGSTENGKVFVTGPLFNPALGTLTGVSATVEGLLDESFFTPSTGLPPTIEFTLHGDFEAPGPYGTQPLSLGNFTVTGNGNGDYTGVTGFRYTEQIAPFGSYIEGSPNAANFLAAVDFYGFPTNGGGLGASSDFSTWSGTLAITYTYDVPEPWSVVVLAFGIAACMMCRGFSLSRQSA